MWIQRKISGYLTAIAAQRPVVVVSGARQSGKTAVLEHTFPHVPRVSLDVPLLAQEAEEAGQGFLERHGVPLLIDEVQYAPGLFRYLKVAVDADRERNGRFLLTGSQKFTLMQGVSESLAGRAALIDLHSLSLAELAAWSGATPTRAQQLQWLFQGGYPEVHAAQLSPERYYADYLATYLERDVRQVLEVRNLRNFDRFLRLLATRTGQLLSMNQLAGDIGISVNTVKSWLSVLEASNVIVLLEPYYRNLGKRVVKTPKLYFLDTGLACYLAGFRSTTDLEHSQLLGAFFETLALGQIIRWFTNRARQPTVYFYRDHQGHEVDFVIPVGEKLKLIECKWSERPQPANAGFQAIEKLIGAESIISRTVIIPEPGFTRLRDVVIEDCVELRSLAD